jgi:glycosyltransferase involved in cell wall biosynthesis
MLRRDLVDIVGYLDTAYEKGNYEDDDFCLRARMAGYRLAIVKNSFVYHMGSATFTKNKISHVQYMEQNRRLFYEKAGRIATSRRGLPPAQQTGSRETSVIIRTLNRPLLLQNALISLANQTSQSFEVIVVNDGGEDIAGLLDQFRSAFPIEYIFHPASKGRSASANVGMCQSRGKWIAFLDDDDILYPWHFESLLQAARLSDSKFVYSDHNRVLFLTPALTSPDKLVGAPPWEFKREQLLARNFLPIHTWLFARECIEKVGLIDESLDRLEDYDFLLRMSAAYPFHHLPRVTCEYRYYLHSPNSIYTDVQKSLDALQVIYQRHPTTDAEVIYDRAAVLNTTKNQIDRIEKIKSSIGNGMTEQEAQRQIMKAVVGL